MADYETEATQVPIITEEEVFVEPPKTDAPRKAPKVKKERAAPYKGKEAKKPPKEKKTKKIVPTTVEDVVAEGSSGGACEQPGEAGVGGTYTYDTIEELLDNLEDDVHSYVCPIHTSELMQIHHSKKEHVTDTFLSCKVEGCPCVCTTAKYEDYFAKVRDQAHMWFTRDRIAQMKCGCGFDPTLKMSNSPKNPGRMYITCRDNLCDIFSWWNAMPNRFVHKIMMTKYDK